MDENEYESKRTLYRRRFKFKSVKVEKKPVKIKFRTKKGETVLIDAIEIKALEN